MSEFIEHAKSMRPRTAIAPPKDIPPLIDTSKTSPSVTVMADIVNNAAAPFHPDAQPDPKKGDAGKVEFYVGAVMGVVGAPFELLDTGFALVTAPLAALMPGFPAAVLFMPHLGTMHGHAHPPSLIPPSVVPVPLPSIGTVLTAGCVSVLIGGVPAARAGDLGLAITCFSFGPAFRNLHGLQQHLDRRLARRAHARHHAPLQPREQTRPARRRHGRRRRGHGRRRLRGKR